MKSGDPGVNKRKLTDKLGFPPQFGPLIGLVATTFEMQPEFFETEFLPAVLNLGAWDDRSWTSRIEIERNLAHMEAAVLFLDASRYRNRPRSLRVRITPVSLGGSKALHAKVVMLVHERAVRTIVGSANFTVQGYRENREAAAVLTVTEKDAGQAPLILSALSGFPGVLGNRWDRECEQISRRAVEFIQSLEKPSGQEKEWFVWGGGDEALWKSFMSRWPQSDKVSKITIVSPFWSEDDQHIALKTLASILKERGCLKPGAEVLLLTEATPDTQKSYKPTLPIPFGSFDFRSLGISVKAQAVDPQVSKEEVGIEGFNRNRALHAKVLLLEGPQHSLAYLGSANFTRQGWGFLDDPGKANVEAGLVMLRERARARSELNLIPAGTGAIVELTGSVEDRLARSEVTTESALWPRFVQDIVLTPAANNPDLLELLILLDLARTQGFWEISIPEKDSALTAKVLLNSSHVPQMKDSHMVPLEEDALKTLLREQEVIVHWWGSEIGQPFPINVAPEARYSLPISPESARFTEERLIMYYQGKIAWEDLFPEPTEVESPPPGPEDETVSGVDTSRIQSYQIREFIEALRGIMVDLKAAARSTDPAMRLALLGPVSPLALARVVVDAVNNEKKSPTAAGFQLVEIRACLVKALGYDTEEKHRKSWQRFIQQALERVDHLLDGLRGKFPSELSEKGFFSTYEQSIREHYTMRGPKE